MSIYYYSIGKNKALGYNTIGMFRCPEAIKEIKEAGKEQRKMPWMIEGYQGRHSEAKRLGDISDEVIRNEKEECPEGTIIRIERLRRKVAKGNEPMCKCGQKFIWQGYPVWYEYKDPKVKTMRLGMFGNIRMGIGKDKTYWKRWFKTRKSRDMFINRFLEKHKR